MTVSNKNTHLIKIIKSAELPGVITSSDLIHLIEGTSARRQALIKRALANGDLVQIRRGLYMINKIFQDKKTDSFELAQWIYGPSYISFESALSHWQLIPEAVYTVTSASSRRSVEFKTPLGVFSYVRIPFSPLFTGVQRYSKGNSVFFMAKPWRALCDYVYASKKMWAIKELVEFLRLEDLPPLAKRDLVVLNKFYRNRRVNRFLNTVNKMEEI